MNNSSKEDTSPSASFQKLCQYMLDGSSQNLTKKNVEDFRVMLHMIMHECSKANIETGKHWVFEHCRTSAHVAALMDYIYSLTKSRPEEEERLYMLYLINDIVYHISRKHLSWMRDAILPPLTPFLKLVYDGITTPELKAKVTKVIDIWYTKKIFESTVIDGIQKDVTGQVIPRQADAPSPQPQATVKKQRHQTRSLPASTTQQHWPVSSPATAQVPVVERPYFELPAGLMLLTKQSNNPYEPLDPDTIKVPYPRPVPTKEMITAVDDFYAGMELVNADDVLLNGKHGQNNKDTQGWERGYLDGYREALLQQKIDELKRQKSMGASKHYHGPPSMADMNRDAHNGRRSPGFSSGSRSRSRSRSPSRRRGRDRGRGRRERSYSYSRSRSRSRSYSPDYRHHYSSNSSSRRSRRSYSRSRSPPSYHRGGGRRASPSYRDRSPPRGRSPSGRGRRPSPPRNYHSRPYDHQRRYSRSPSPPSSSSYRQPPASQPAATSPSTSIRPNPSHASSTYSNASNQYPQSRGTAPTTSGGGGASSVGVKSNVDSMPPAVPLENKYMGLGSKSSSSTADEFDSFRRNKSHAFSNREPPQPFTCYKCNKTGHLARECTSL